MSYDNLGTFVLAMPDPYSYDRTVTKPSLSSLTGNFHISETYASSFYEPARSIREQFVSLMAPGASYFECRLEAQSPSDFLCHQPLATVAGSDHTIDYGIPTPLRRPSASPPQVYDDVPELIQPVYHQIWDSQRTHGLDSHPPSRQHSLLRIPELQQHNTLLTYSPTVPRPLPLPLSWPHHDHDAQEGQHRSCIQQINDLLSACTITCDDRRLHSSTPGSSYSRRSRTNENPNTLSWGAKRCVGTHSSPPSGKRQRLDRKPTLACSFCRTHKVACRASLPGSLGKACSQCQRRSLPCEFLPESRQGMRKRRVLKGL